MKSLANWLQHVSSTQKVGEAMGRTHLQMSQRTGVGYRLQVKWAVGRGKEREAATRRVMRTYDSDGLTLHEEVENII